MAWPSPFLVVFHPWKDYYYYCYEYRPLRVLLWLRLENGPARMVISRSSTEGTAGSNVSADKDKDHLLRRLDREITIYLKTVVFLNYWFWVFRECTIGGQCGLKRVRHGVSKCKGDKQWQKKKNRSSRRIEWNGGGINIWDRSRRRESSPFLGLSSCPDQEENNSPTMTFTSTGTLCLLVSTSNE